MVEVLIMKLPDGTKSALKQLAKEEGYMHMSDLVRDLLRKEFLKAREQKIGVERKSEGQSGG